MAISSATASGTGYIRKRRSSLRSGVRSLMRIISCSFLRTPSSQPADDCVSQKKNAAPTTLGAGRARAGAARRHAEVAIDETTAGAAVVDRTTSSTDLREIPWEPMTVLRTRRADIWKCGCFQPREQADSAADLWERKSGAATREGYVRALGRRASGRVEFRPDFRARRLSVGERCRGDQRDDEAGAVTNADSEQDLGARIHAGLLPFDRRDVLERDRHR